nr:LuxR C-terminal-related transcriptional regulator [Burkholderia ubonensis]
MKLLIVSNRFATIHQGMFSSKPRVIIADNHPVTLAGVSHILSDAKTVSVVGACRTSTELLAALGDRSCDIVISGYVMQGGRFGDGIALFSYIRRRYPHIRLVALTMVKNPLIIHKLVAQGISAIVSKSDGVSHIVDALHAGLRKGAYLSPTIEAIVRERREMRIDVDVALSTRETEVVRLFASGLSGNEIADRLKRSKQTISAQKASAMRKLGIGNDVDLFQYALRAKLVMDSPAP